MLIDASYVCAFCGESNDTSVDPSGGSSQNYVEDCQVCCRANVLRISVDAESQVAYVSNELAYD